MFDGKLNKFCKDVNEITRNKGFWDNMHIATDRLENNCHTVQDKEILKATKDAFISQKIALITSECGEALEAMRKDNYGVEEKDSFEDEIADTIIRLCDLCGELNIDIEKQISWKLEYNKSRQTRHGKNF